MLDATPASGGDQNVGPPVSKGGKGFAFRQAGNILRGVQKTDANLGPAVRVVSIAEEARGRTTCRHGQAGAGGNLIVAKTGSSLFMRGEMGRC